MSRVTRLHRYRSSQDRIDETDESKEQTLNVIKHPHDLTLNRDLLATKKDLLRRFYTNPNQKQRKGLIAQWPNPTVQQMLHKHGIVELQNRTYLVGGAVNNLIEGYALVMYSPSRFYEGNFQNNVKHGQGFEFLPNGVYVGNFVNNKPEGKGSFYWNNNEAYEGEFLAGMKHGSGRWTSTNQTYVGQWKTNKPDGMGVIITRQSRYEGEVQGGLKHGHGKEVFKNGDRYTGSYVNGRPEGVGEYVWAKNISNYKGYFKNGLRHGNGVWTQSGDRYQGHYLNDKKNGKGKFTWASGNCYIGSYFDDLRHGYGQMHWKDGSWYKGEWKYGVQHGLGQTQENTEPPKRGIFENNVLVCQDDDRRMKKQRVRYVRKLDAIRDRNYTNYDVKPTEWDASFNSRIPSFTIRKPMRKKNLSPAARFTMNMGDEAKSQTSLEEKEIKSTQLHRRRSKQKTPPRKQVKSQVNSAEDDGNVIQWANIKSFDVVPPARTHVRSLHRK